MRLDYPPRSTSWSERHSPWPADDDIDAPEPGSGQMPSSPSIPLTRANQLSGRSPYSALALVVLSVSQHHARARIHVTGQEEDRTAVFVPSGPE